VHFGSERAGGGACAKILRPVSGIRMPRRKLLGDGERVPHDGAVGRDEGGHGARGRPGRQLLGDASLGEVEKRDAERHTLSRVAMRAELLDAETELKLAYAWRDHRDEKALHRLITAYMRLAISMAAKFKRYGAPMNDLIQEAGLG
jgi:hypothetical protein